MNRSKQIALAALATVAVCGLCFATWPEQTIDSSLEELERAMQTALADHEERLRAIDREFRQEREQRLALAEEVSELRRELETTSAAAERSRAVVEQAADDEDLGLEEVAEESGPRGLDIDALVEVGFPASTVRAFKERID